MIGVGQIWTHKLYNDNAKIIEINYRTYCIKFDLGTAICVSNISSFQMRYFYNAKLTNEEIIRNIIE